jgi:hypothetical protein
VRCASDETALKSCGWGETQIMQSMPSLQESNYLDCCPIAMLSSITATY